jgi:hypothetical protein
MFKYIASVLITLALIVPASASQFIEVKTDPCRTFEIQKAEVKAARPDVTIVSPLDDEGVVVYKQVDGDITTYIASHFNADGCLDGILVLNQDEYNEYFGIVS